MGFNCTSTLASGWTAQQTSSSVFSSGNQQLAEAYAYAFKNGVGADQINLASLTRYAFTASTPQTATFTTLLDVFGNACAFARLHFFGIKIYTQNDAASLTIGNAAVNKWTGFITGTGTLKIFAASAVNADGGFLMVCAPNTTGMLVAVGANEQLLMTPSAHAFNADLVLLGCDV